MRLPLMAETYGVTAVHASLYEPEKWHYILGETEAIMSFSKLNSPVCFVGHSHIPAVFVREGSGDVSIQKASRVPIEPGKKYIINVGSVGQPRDNDARACGGFLDTEAGEFQLLRIAYPIWLVQEKMVQFELPMALVERLTLGL